MSSDRPHAIDVLVPIIDGTEDLSWFLAAVPRCSVRQLVVVRVGEVDVDLGPAEEAGAVILTTPKGGVGSAVQCGLSHLESSGEPPDSLVVLAADGTDDPAEIPVLLRPIVKGGYDLVIGSRLIGPQTGAGIHPLDRAGNALAVNLIRVLYGYSYTDLSTFLAIRFPALIALGVSDGGPGFSAELRVKALKVGLRVAEVPVTRREARPGQSEVGLRERLDAGYRSLYQILRNATLR